MRHILLTAKNKTIVLFLSFLFLLLSCSTYGQEVFATLDTNTIRIGEQAKIDLYVKYKATQKTQIHFPAIGDTLRKEIDVVAVSKIDTTTPNKSNPDEIYQHQSIIITSSDSGFWAIAPFTCVVNKDTLRTEPLLLTVMTLPVDTAETSIKDIKAPFEEPITWRDYLTYIYGGVAVLVLLLVSFFIYRKYFKKKTIQAAPPKPQVPPHITALEQLELIKTKKIWQEGKYKEYHTQISDALRAYIENRYHIMAMELTSDEILKTMSHQVIDAVSKEKLKQVLTLADYVKFAKVIPIDVENELSLSNAFDFVNGTKREVESKIQQNKEA
ncbi:MAG: hypothetical protein JST67_11715 [Bacteroidetes bacterium]|nr:hypothetical protein [Bacteroidota bacterium]